MNKRTNAPVFPQSWSCPPAMARAEFCYWQSGVCIVGVRSSNLGSPTKDLGGGPTLEDRESFRPWTQL